MKLLKTTQILTFFFVGNLSFAQTNEKSIDKSDYIMTCGLAHRNYECELPVNIQTIKVAPKPEIIKEEFTFSIYPNPASEKINLKLDQKVTGFQMTIIDMLGNHVFEKNYSAVELRAIDVSALKNGCYLVKITAGEKTAVKQLVINK